MVGPQKQIESIAIGPDDDIEQRRQDIVSAVRNVDSGSGVVVFTDMFGGTPSNLAISIMNGSNIEVIAAVNLPMLIKLASVRETASLEQAVIQAQDVGRTYICVASRVSRHRVILHQQGSGAAELIKFAQERPGACLARARSAA